MSFQAVERLIKKHKRFLVTTHTHPDPDALSSQLAMAEYLKFLGKKVHLVNDSEVPTRLRFLPGTARIKSYQSLKKGQPSPWDVVIIVDCGDLERVGKVQGGIGAGQPIVNIDHHVTNDSFGDVPLVKPNASSTAEVLFDFFQHARFPLTKKVAMLLYLGIMTDTGSFRYDNTSAHTHQVAGELLRFGIPVDQLYRRLYEMIPLKDLRHFGKVVNEFDFLYDGKLVCLDLPRRRVKQFSKEFDLRDKIFQYLRAIKGVEVIAIFTEQRKNITRVNFRSQGQVNVARLASFFNGGGHRKASGCVLMTNLRNTRRKVIAKIREGLK